MHKLRLASYFFVAAFVIVAAPLPAQLSSTLTIEPITWNIIGLDSNDPSVGPNHFPVGVRVCSSVATTDVDVDFVWDSANPYINLRPGSFSTITIASIGAGECVDVYFEVEVTRDAAAYETARRYHITATDTSGTVSTPIPRELYVEYLISQSRNAIDDVRYGTDPLDLTSVPPGGEMDLVVGETYTIQLIDHTATQGYNQIEAFINFPNTIFQILSVETTYSADNSPYVDNPHNQLYGDACLWENDPNSPNYRSCIGGDFKAGGDIVTTYTIRIIDGGGTSERLSTLLYDFSGSSFHYNSDFVSGYRIANLIDPLAAGIAKSFNPNPVPVDAVTTLTFTLTNPNAGALAGYNFTDNLPANLEVAATPGVTTSGCGTATVTATAGSSTITVDEATVGANGTCLISVNVTPTAIGTWTNTTSNLFIGDIDTGKTATADLTVNNEPPPGTGICGDTLARWNFDLPMNTTSPAPTTGTGTASAGAGLNPASSTEDNTISPAGTGSWRSNGGIATGTPLNTANNDYFQFAIDTTGYTAIEMSFDAFRTQNGPRGVALYWGTSATPPGTQAFATDVALVNATTWYSFTHNFTSGLNPSGLTYFRIYGYNSLLENPGADFNIDNVLFLGCQEAAEPAITKAFSPDEIAINGVSTLTFTLTNPNSVALTGAAFTDSLPAGVQVAATPSASATCGGTWAPTAGSTSLTFTGGTIPASGSCTLSVNVTATTGGPHANISGYLSTIESGTSTGGVATADLTAIVPPEIAKQFDPSPILPGGVSTLTFTLTNQNQDDALSGVAFSDTFPTSPGAMVVAATPNATTSGCGSPTFAPSASAGSISFSGGTIAAGGTCIVTVDVTATAVGSYDNISGNVSYVINAQTVNGNTAAATLVVEPPSPSISLLKQVSTTSTGPWTAFVAVETGDPVYYRFTIENTGDVALTNITITDDTLNVSGCNASLSGATLPAPVAANENHIVTCVSGPVAAASGSHSNTASVSGDFGGTTYNSGTSVATYATTGLTLSKSATQATFTNDGDVLDYSYLVTNSGFAPLLGPVTVSDDKAATVTCPAVNTIGDLDNYLDPGEAVTCTATYAVTATDVANGQVTNTATATVDGVTSEPDSVRVPSSLSADVSLTKTLDTAGPFSPGQTITYTIVVANAGPATATGIDVTDTPTNLTITSVTGACTALPCVIASIASGADATITVTATIDATGAFDNSATATADELDPDTANNTDDEGNDGTAVAADVSLTKTLDTAGPYSPGQTITWTIVVANAGPDTATSIDVTDTPANLTITNVTGACTALPCVIASIASGADATITVTATIDAAGAFDNSATATADEFDPDTTNNTDDDGNGGTAGAELDLEITKTASTDRVEVGQLFEYTLTVVNHGPATATNVVVSDTLPASFALESMTTTQGSCSGTTTITCNLGTMATDATVTIVIRGRATAKGTLSNTATVDSDQTEAITTNNDSTADIVASQAVAGIPTVSEWGLFTMMLALAAFGALRLRS